MIKAIYTSEASGQPMTKHSEIRAVEGQGLEGDRYSTGKGFYSGEKEWDANIALMQIEPFIELQKNHGIDLDPIELRRNLIVESISLNFLVGKTFQIGDEVILETRKLWPPCAHIVKQTGKTEIFQYLAESTGIGATVLVGGTIKLGDSVFPVPHPMSES